MASGKLPAGLSLSQAGVLSGTPTAVTALSRVTVKTIDSSTPTRESKLETIQIKVAPRTPTITTTGLPAGRVGNAYSQTLEAALAVAPVQWRIASGSLPAGLALGAGTGTISGTPTQSGASSFTVEVTDSTGLSASEKLSITVDPAVQAAVFVAQGGYSGVESFALGANGNVAPLSTITGSATGLSGTRAVTIDPTGQVYVSSDSNDEIAEYAYGANGNVAPTAVLAGSNTQLASPAGMAISSSGELYVANPDTNSITVYAAGASGNASPVAVISGSLTALDQPEALTFDSSGNLWVANTVGNVLTEYPANANGNVQPASFISGSATQLDGPSAITLDGQGNLLVANTYGGSLTEYSPTQAYNVSPLRTISGAATGLQGKFPDGVDVDTNGNIYVADEFGGLEEFSATASGNATPIAAVSGSATGLSSPEGVAVAPPLSVGTHSLPVGRVGRRYRTQLEANLGTTPYRWHLIAGHLPSGLTLSRKGTISGTPRHAGSYRFTVRVRDHSRPRMSATQALVLHVHRRSRAAQLS